MIEAARPASQAAIDEYTAKGWWRDRTFFEVIERHAKENPQREAMVDNRRRITYAQLWAEVKRFAEFLRRQGVKRGDVVTLQLPNRIEFPVVFYSLELIGAVANKISADFRSVEVEYILKFSQSRVYVCASQFKGFDYLAMIRELRPRLPDLQMVVCVDDVDAADVRSFGRVMDETPEIADNDRVRMDPFEIMRMCFTSGTTGNPKGVLHCTNTTLCTSELINKELKVTERDVLLDYLPVGLNWGYITLVQTVIAGAKVVLMERFTARVRSRSSSARRYLFPTAPASIVAMLNSPDLKKRDLSSLRVVITGGASAAVETIKAFQAALPSAR